MKLKLIKKQDAFQVKVSENIETLEGAKVQETYTLPMDLKGLEEWKKTMEITFKANIDNAKRSIADFEETLSELKRL